MFCIALADCSPEGAAVLSVQGNALGMRENEKDLSAQRAKGSSNSRRIVGPLGRIRFALVPFPQGDALGWENGGPSAQ